MEVGVCNIRSVDFDKELLNSVINTGFVVITHHGIDHSLIRDVQQGWREFFNREQIYKNLFINGNNDNMGYKGFGTETAVGSKVADMKEFFHWKPGEDMPESVTAITRRMFYRLEDVGFQILSVLEKAARANYVFECYESNNTLLRTLYYPSLAKMQKDGVEPKKDAVRAAAHEDINHITLLVAASAPGLQVKDAKGNWHDVPHENNSIIVNIGDMLQLESNGLFKSTTHRVINPENDASDRVSMPLFIHPHSSTYLAPGYTAGQFLKERIDQIYGKKK